MKFINIVIKVILFILILFSTEFSGIVNNNKLPIIGNNNNKLSILIEFFPKRISILSI